MKSDVQLQQDVLAELRWNPAVHAAEIGVAVKHGVVTLTGEVRSLPEKCEAQGAAQRVVGVQMVVIALEVKLSAPGARPDSDIARSAEAALSSCRLLPPGAIKVIVESGLLTLSGEVEWQYQRAAAVASVPHLEGASGVDDEIVLVPANSTEVEGFDIERGLDRVVDDDAKHISVVVQGSDVSLSGTVKGGSARDSAVRCAWSARGVCNVTDHTTFAPSRDAARYTPDGSMYGLAEVSPGSSV